MRATIESVMVAMRWRRPLHFGQRRTSTAKDLDGFLYDVQLRTNAESLERIRQRKPDMVVIELDEEQRDRFRQRALPVRETFRRTVGERGSRLLDSLLAALERAERGN